VGIGREPLLDLLDPLIGLVDRDHRVDASQTAGDKETIQETRFGHRFAGGEDKEGLINIRRQYLGAVL